MTDDREHDDAPSATRSRPSSDLEHLAEQEGVDGLRVAAELIEDELKAKSRTRRIVEIVRPRWRSPS